MLKVKTTKPFTLTLLATSLLMMASASQAKTLQEVIKENIYTSPYVEQAKYQQRSDASAIDEARAGYFPKVDVSFGSGREHTYYTNGVKVDKTLNRREGALTVTQMLFDGFQTRSEVARETAAADASAWKLSSETDRVALEIARAYLNVYRRTQLMRLAEENLAKHQNIYEQIRQRSQSGVASQAELAQAESRLSLAQANTVSARNNLSDVKATYQQIVGQPSDDDVTFPDFDGAWLPPSVDDAVTRAIDNNYVLKSATSDIDEAQAQIRSRESAYLPRVTVELGRTWNNNIDGIEGKDSDYQAMLKVNYNLFNGGADKARHMESVEQLGKAKAIRDQTYREVVESMQLSWSAYEWLSQQVPHYQDQVKAADQTRELYKQQFNLGQRSLLDLLDSENELFEARNSLVNAQSDMRLAQYRILAASSSLMTSVESPDAAPQQAATETAQPEDSVQGSVDHSMDQGDQEVLASVEGWRQAWQSRDVDAYLSHYASNFAPEKGSYAAWEKDRRSKLTYPQWIELTIGEPQVSMVDGKAIVRFDQHYKANHFEDNVVKELTMEQENGEWKIVEERSI